MPVDGNARILYFEKGVFQGERACYLPGHMRASGERISCYWPNTAYFCPSCGEIWARAVFDFSFDYKPLPQAAWVAEIRKCAEHGDGHLLIGQDDSSLSFCSTKLLAREALLYCLAGPPAR